MGVDKLWDILEETKTIKSLEDIKGEKVAVDLATWICEAEGVEMLNRNVQKPYLRNMLFRLIKFSCNEVKLIFVADGSPPALKHHTIAQRLNLSQPLPSNTPWKRNRLNAKLKECCDLLDALGIPYVKSEGEAEATCAALNKCGFVDACATNDGDAFLYGAERVYRKLVAEKDMHIECYEMSRIKSKLSLDQARLISLGLLLGCDYCDGVPGIGKVRASNWLKSLPEDENPLETMKNWKNYEFTSCQVDNSTKPAHCSYCKHEGSKKKHSDDGCGVCGFECKQELYNSQRCTCTWHIRMKTQKLKEADENIIRLSNKVPDFPNQSVVNEFQKQVKFKELREPRMPRLSRAAELASKKLGWKFKYTVEKLLPMLTHWILHHSVEGSSEKLEIEAHKITHTRIRNGVPMYEIIWKLSSIPGISELTTLEKRHLINAKFPELSSSYWERIRREKEEKKASKKIAKAKTAKTSGSRITDYWKIKKSTGEKRENTKPQTSAVDSVMESFSQLTVSPPIVISSDDDDVTFKDVLRECPRNSTTFLSKFTCDQENSFRDNLSSSVLNYDSYDASADLFDVENTANTSAQNPEKENEVPTPTDSSTKPIFEPESPIFMSLTDRIRLKSAPS